jgi:AraC-like DNA-binding protein
MCSIAQPLNTAKVGMSHINFSSSSLPDELDDRQRFNLWRDLYMLQFGGLDFETSDQLPFSASLDIALVGPVAVGRMNGTIERVTRSARDVARDGQDTFSLVFNGGQTMSGALARRDYELAGGGAVLMPYSEPGSMFRRAIGTQDDWLNIRVPGQLLRLAISNPDDLVARAIPAGSEALTLLAGYTGLLRKQGAIESPALLSLATNTLLDLMALALGATGEKQETASGRGLRNARLHAILGQIATRYTEATFSTRDVAVALGLSSRYVNELLYESGTNFSDRVLELRLQHARAMLCDPRHEAKRISEIAYMSGFADISYFNRNFRRRFGTTPTGAR